MVFSFKNEVAEYLKNNKGKAFTSKELAEIIADKFPKECRKKIENSKSSYITTERECIQQWAREIGSCKNTWQKKNIAMTAENPRRYYYHDEKMSLNISNSDNKSKNNQPEKELYPILAEFCNSIGIKTLRIDEKGSKKNGGKNHNKWLHADVVGFQDLINNFNPQAKECLIEYSDERSYLYSFEVKDGFINPSELREYFFQTVSNSSWANFSYLVAEGVNDKAMNELQLLCSSFNIGFIKLDREEPTESLILIKAPKTQIDWNMVSRIADENKDFQAYLKNITLSYKGHSDKYAAKPVWDIN